MVNLVFMEESGESSMFMNFWNSNPEYVLMPKMSSKNLKSVEVSGGNGQSSCLLFCHKSISIGRGKSFAHRSTSCL